MKAVYYGTAMKGAHKRRVKALKMPGIIGKPTR
jgi:hypothetical protein